MNNFRLLLCCFLLLSEAVWADDVRQDDRVDKSDKVGAVRAAKIVGPASSADSYDGVGKTAHVNFTGESAQEHQRRQMSNDERQALRRQINEAGNRYSGNK